MQLGDLAPLGPIVAIAALGFAVGRRGWLGPKRVRALSNVVFIVFTPALLFRTMSQVHVEQLDFRPLGSYFIAVAILFAATFAWCGFNRRATVLALANTYSNNIAIGIPLVVLAYGQAGLVPLLTLISVHALVLLTAATLLLEMAVQREDHAHATRSAAASVFLALRNSLIHPVPLPIIAGLAFAASGLAMPPLVDKPLLWLGFAFGPLALILVGATLANTQVHGEWRGALKLSLVKNFVHPALVAVVAMLLALPPLERNVMVLAAAVPIGANVFLFSQRYRVAEDTITTALAISTALAIPSLAMVLAALGWLGP